MVQLGVTHEGASTKSNDDNEGAQVGDTVWQRVASIIHDCRISAYSKYWENVLDRQRQNAEVGNGGVADPGHGQVLQRDDGVVEGGDGDSVDSVSGTRRKPWTNGTIISWNYVSVEEAGDMGQKVCADQQQW